MELTGVVELADLGKRKSTNGKCSRLPDVKFAKDISEIKDVDVAIVSCPSRSVKATVSRILQMGINTVDSFDVHPEIPSMRRELNAVAKAFNVVSIISAGWDPGIDSVIRGWFTVMAPKGITHTNYGPGMSMGHTCAVKSINGVKDALSITVPAGMGIHRRMVDVELEPVADFHQIEQAIKHDPYFIEDRTYVYEVADVNNLIDVGHGVLMERRGVSGISHNQQMRFEMRINNPAVTSQVMVSAARAAIHQKPGCYTMIEIPVIDFLSGEVEDFVTKLV